jgi:spore germination cell wall hydrolase CwlJ-like protein
VARPDARPRALDCLAAAVYYEARGENPAGRAAVAQVVLNRTRRPGYPKSVCAVVYQGSARKACQFSFACNGAMTGRREDAAWLDARRIAARALRGYVFAAVGRATCFHAVHARAAVEGGLRLGGQVFYAAS